MTVPSSLALRKFVAPEFIFGVGARLLVSRFARHLGAKRVLVVTDPGVQKVGWTQDVLTELERAQVVCEVFSQVSPNPRAEEVMQGAERYLSAGANAIVAVGGGSVIDCAKGIGVVVAEGRSVLEFEGVDMVEAVIPPLVCIPTTGGTSADVSQFAIISDPSRRTKIAIISKAIVPDIALIDPLTLTTKGPELSANTGLDVLTHAVEAFVSNASSPITDGLALKAVARLCQSLPRTLEAPEDVAARGEVMLASLEAGLAFSNASLGAVHAMAHSLGGLLDLPHGLCNAILLPHVIAFNYRAEPERFAAIAEAMGLPSSGLSGRKAQQTVVEGVMALKHRLGVTRTLSQCGVKVSDVQALAQRALKDACMATNPLAPNQRDVEVLYEEAL